MTTKAESYLKRAEQLEALARLAQADASKTIYEHLAWSYRQLGVHAHRASEKDAEHDGLTERIVAGDGLR
jgi:hypothetical protein